MILRMMQTNTMPKFFLSLLWCFTLLSLTAGTFVSLTLVDVQTVQAQDPEDEEEDEDDSDSSDTDENDENLLGWMIGALSYYSIVFLILSFMLVALIVMNILTARRDNIVPLHLVEEFENHFNEKRYQEAYELAKNDDSVLGQILSAGLSKLQTGYPQAIEGMQEVAEEESMKMEHRLSYMALIGTISPMIGLFGTVDGMIRSFKTIATSSGATPEASKLAEGISTALFTTLVGLFIAIPAISIYNILRNRVAKLMLEAGILSEGLMSRFQSVGAGKK